MEKFSLLYPDGSDSKSKLRESVAAFEEVGLAPYFELKNSDASDYFTDDCETVLYRQKTFSDIINTPEVVRTLKRCVPILNDIISLRNVADGIDSDSSLLGITEVELYMSLLELLEAELLPMKEKLASPAMTELCLKIENLCNSDYYKDINKKLSELTNRVREIKSVTIGVNLNGSLRPEYAGVLSVNNEKFRSGQTLDKILHLDFKQSELNCIAPLIAFDKSMSESEQLSMTYALNGALSHVFKSNFKSWKKIVASFVSENTAFLIDILPEIEFVSKAVDFVEMLGEKGIKTVFPEVVDSGDPVFEAKGIVNSVIALKTEGETVKNDFAYEGDERIFVITGPNRGGKSVITCAVGQTVLLAALGLPVCAEVVRLTLADNLFCHFPGGSDETVNKGRLGEECDRLSSIISNVTEKSVVLLDESLSSTGSFEASYIASRLLIGFSVAGCRCIFSTHLHSLAAELDSINEEANKMGGHALASLVAQIDNGERSFKITRAKPDGKSYAEDIAEKYGLSIDGIMKKINGNKN